MADQYPITIIENRLVGNITAVEIIKRVVAARMEPPLISPKAGSWRDRSRSKERVLILALCLAAAIYRFDLFDRF
jgi:hypothetical protein